jgi:hypothetical protein
MTNQSDLRSPSSSSGSNDLPKKEDRKRKEPPTTMPRDGARVKTGAPPAISIINGHTMSIQKSLGKAAREKMIKDNKYLLPIRIDIPFINVYYDDDEQKESTKKKSANPSVVLVGINWAGISKYDSEVLQSGPYLEVQILEFEAETVQEIHKDIEGDWTRNKTIYTIVQETIGATDHMGGDANLPVSLNSIWEDIHKVMDVKLRNIKHKEGCLSLKSPKCAGGPMNVLLMPFVNPYGRGHLCPNCLGAGVGFKYTWKSAPFQLLTQQVITFTSNEGKKSEHDVIDADDDDDDEIEVYSNEKETEKIDFHSGATAAPQ